MDSYINGVLARQRTVLTNSITLSRPSQPNYLQLFSGSPQTAPRSNVRFLVRLPRPEACRPGTGSTRPIWAPTAGSVAAARDTVRESQFYPDPSLARGRPGAFEWNASQSC